MAKKFARTVTMPSSVMSGSYLRSSHASGAGYALPDVSMMIRSGACVSTISSMAVPSCPTSTQHKHPLMISLTCPSAYSTRPFEGSQPTVWQGASSVYVTLQLRRVLA